MRANVIQSERCLTVEREAQHLLALARKLAFTGRRDRDPLEPYTANHCPLRENQRINDVLCREYQDRFSFVLPVFMHLAYQTITNIQLDICVAEISSILTVTVYYGDLPTEFVDELAENIQLRISNRCELYLKEDQFVENLVSNLLTSRNEEQRVLIFTIHAMLPVEIRCDVFWTPFETLYLRMTVKIATQSMKFLDKQAQVHFNILYSGECVEKMNQKLRDYGQMSFSARLRDFFSVERYVENEKDRTELDQSFDISNVERYNEYGVSRTSRRFAIYKSSTQTDKRTLKGFWWRFKKCLGFLKHSGDKDDEAIPSKKKHKKKPNGQQNESPESIEDAEQDEQLRAHQAERSRIINQLKRHGIQQQECFFIDAIKPRQEPSLKVIAYNIGLFEFKLFRHPLTTVIEILIPAVFLALINLAIYFQEVALSNRIASIATLLVAYTTFLPTVRQRIPPSPRLTLIEMLLYAIMLSSSLCLLRSFIDRNENPDTYEYRWREDPCFIISITLLVFVLTVVLLGLFIRRIQVAADAHGEDKFSDALSQAKPAPRVNWSNHTAERTYYTEELFDKYQPYSKPFVKKQSIFQRLWLWRHKKGLLEEGPESDPQCDKEIPLTINLAEMHQNEMHHLVTDFRRTYEEFFIFVNRVLYLDELNKRLQEIRQKDPRIAKFYEERKIELEKAIAKASGGLSSKTSIDPNNPRSIVDKYRLARIVLMLQYIRMEEHIEESIEFCFEQPGPEQPDDNGEDIIMEVRGNDKQLPPLSLVRTTLTKEFFYPRLPPQKILAREA